MHGTSSARSPAAPAPGSGSSSASARQRPAAGRCPPPASGTAGHPSRVLSPPRVPASAGRGGPRRTRSTQPTRLPSIMQPTLEQLLEAGVHFGHQTRRWNPKMRRFIFAERNGIHIIDLQKTLRQIELAQKLVREVVMRGDNVLFVCTKRQLAAIVQGEAERSGALFVTERWLGGLLTNFQTIKKQIRRLKELEAGTEAGGEFEAYTKKEQLLLTRQRDKLSKYLKGIKNMGRLPGLLVRDRFARRSASPSTRRTSSAFPSWPSSTPTPIRTSSRSRSRGTTTPSVRSSSSPASWRTPSWRHVARRRCARWRRKARRARTAPTAGSSLRPPETRTAQAPPSAAPACQARGHRRRTSQERRRGG